MEPTHYISDDDTLVKKPIEKIHRHCRFNHLLKKILKENTTIVNGTKKIIDRNILDHIIFEVYDAKNDKVVKEQISWRNFLAENKHKISVKDYYLELPVISHTTKYVGTNSVIKTSAKNSLSEGLVQRVYTHYIKLKFLPQTYVEHVFYKTGLINELIYDMVMTSSDPDPRTVIGTEAYDKIEKLCASQTPGNDITFYKNRYNIDKKKGIIGDDISLIEYIFSRLCGFYVFIKPSIHKKNEISWYIVSKKRS